MSESRFETEKETLERRLKNAIESNEILRSDRDHFKVECANREMEEHRLKDEVNALKAELVSVDKYAKEQYQGYDAEISKLKAELERMSDDFVKNELDRVTWKSRATKYREALEKIADDWQADQLSKGRAKAAISEETES